MKLKMINESLKHNGIVTLYKGMSEDNFNKFKLHNIPGFLAELALAMIYSEPSLTGKPTDTRYIISTQVDLSKVIDRSDIVDDMCTWTDKKELQFLRNEIWTAPGSGHGNLDAIYYGKPCQYKLFAIVHGDNEWRQLFNKLEDEGKISFSYIKRST